MTTFEKIQFELNKRNMSGNELAKACHFSSGLYSQWKSGLQKPSADKVVAIADFLGCSVDYLLGREAVYADRKAAFEKQIQHLESQIARYEKALDRKDDLIERLLDATIQKGE